MKFCPKCNKRKGVSDFSKCTKREDGLQRVCKECQNAYNKKHRLAPEVLERAKAYRKKFESRPGFKKWHAEYNREWRKRNHEKAKEINRRASKKRRVVENERKRLLYRTDPEYKRKCLEREQRYKDSGRRLEMRNRYQKENVLELRKKAAKWKRENPERAKAFYKKYSKEVLLPRYREKRKNLDDRYVKRVIQKSVNYRIKPSDIPQSMVEIKRQALLLKRQIKKSHDNNN